VWVDTIARKPSSSNQAGVTLVNDQVGYVVAQVMQGKKDITIRQLPSMIRVDGINTIDLDLRGDRRRPRLADDDRVLMFADPEDAAECIGFDLQPVAEA
jgi:propane monooxygenase coupling protein